MSTGRLSGMSCAFSSLILSRRTCHVVHIGDTRAYRLSEGRLERLTKDHVAGRGDLAHLLNRAIGFEDFARVDYTAVGLRQHDRLLLCSDGVHGVLDDDRLQVLLDARAAPEETARTLVDAALAAGSSDNMTALVLDVVDLPPADRNELTHAIETLADPGIAVVRRDHRRFRARARCCPTDATAGCSSPSTNSKAASWC